MYDQEWDDDGLGGGGLDDGFDDSSPSEEVIDLLASTDGATARTIATSLRYPVDEVREMLEDLHANGEVERDDDRWVVPDMAGPDDPYIF
jgi:predicted ArsR family transcriptional regulator